MAHLEDDNKFTRSVASGLLEKSEAAAIRKTMAEIELRQYTHQTAIVKHFTDVIRRLNALEKRLAPAKPPASLANDPDWRRAAAAVRAKS